MEQRRLLAGLTVFVYDDVNASGDWQEESESGLSDRIIFLDANSDGLLDLDESWGLTDSDGVVSFQGLVPGDYWPTLLTSDQTPVAGVGPDAGAGDAGSNRVIDSDAHQPVIVHAFEEQLSISVGQHLVGANRPPVALGSVEWTLSEDSEWTIDSEALTSLFTDPDGDPITILVSQLPEHGVLQWSSLRQSVYIPAADFDGTDVVSFRAYDGRGLSDPVSVSLRVIGVNDPPVGIDVSTDPVPEDAPPEFAIGHVIVIDPDHDAAYRVTVSDPRFFVADGILKIARHAIFDVENESTITFEIVATDTAHPGDTLSTLVIVDVVEGPGTRYQPGPEPESPCPALPPESGSTAGTSMSGGGDSSTIGASCDGHGVGSGSNGESSDTEGANGEPEGGAGDGTSDPSSTRPAWQNPANPLDVDHDGYITPRDPLAIINHINKFGVHPLDIIPEGEGGIDFYYDVNGDGYVTPIDILIIINELNRGVQGPVNSNPAPVVPPVTTQLPAAEGEQSIMVAPSDAAVTRVFSSPGPVAWDSMLGPTESMDVGAVSANDTLLSAWSASQEDGVTNRRKRS